MRHAISFQDRRSLEFLPVVLCLIAGVWHVGLQPLSRKSRLREFMPAERPFNLRMQALRRTMQCAPILAKVHRRLTTPDGRPPISLRDATTKSVVPCMGVERTSRAKDTR